MAPKKLEACKTHDDFVSYSRKRKARVEPGGRHTLIFPPEGGLVPVPRHKGDLATGTRYSIIKALTALGMAGLVIMVALQALIG